ncbi:DUF2071 domain-containing protein [Rubripirellula lacrimiformis]|uniref:DUF2071 domain-containing protein n=1 Tax=Rubripirellula lacrimiformis TaxID=1930273 RepID=UPI001FE2B964|nr:DUF2071 domain-containing protein [Rubripirellula lacrimiformis]
MDNLSSPPGAPHRDTPWNKMRLPAISGVIDRRILANYRIDPACMAAALPPPFRPQTVNGYAIGGICLIRLKRVRPKLFPVPWGIGSENAAHRIAVQWESNGQSMHGVYIPRRDTNSILNSFAGGRIFPGIHHHAKFTVVECGDRYSVAMASDDGGAKVHVSGSVVPAISDSSVFDSLESASAFFEQGALGYSDTLTGGKFDGLELRCRNWHVESLNVDRIQSSYFEDRSRFPSGSVEFDCALLMRDIAHEWHGRPDLCCSLENGSNR